jgi:outer membrane protein assembly factor BamB
MLTSVRFHGFLSFALFCVLSDSTLVADDWPTYRGDNARSGSSAETIDPALSLRWTYNAPAAPRMAWSSAEGRVIEGKLLGHRVKFDDAFHPAVVGGFAYFGSSVDHQLYCVEIKTGKVAWSFFTGGAIRLAPTVSDGKVLVGSDDGRVYCLNAKDGKLVWKIRAGQADEWLLARGEMISRWPIRTGVLVDDKIAYFGAGIFPHDDIYIYAVNVADGSVVWRQDNISAQDAGRNNLSPQGYLLASGTHDDGILFVPSGRSLPAGLDRKTGKIVHRRSYSWRTTAGGVVGGTRALLTDGQILASGPHHMLAMEQKKGDVGHGWFEGRQMAVAGKDTAAVATGSAVALLKRNEYAVNSRLRQKLEIEYYSLTRKLRSAGKDADKVKARRTEVQKELKSITNVGIAWSVPTTADGSLLLTSNLVFAGGQDQITAFSVKDGKQVWQSKVDGNVRGLIVANGNLIASTDKGQIACFGPSSNSKPTQVDQNLVKTPYEQDEWTNKYAKAADEILKSTKIRDGYCLIVGSESGRLALEIARRSNLKIYGVEQSRLKVEAARNALSKAGVYGSRVVIHHSSLSLLKYSNYFANLIVSDSYLKGGQVAGDWSILARHLKPLGGVVCLGDVSNADKTSSAKQAATTLEAINIPKETTANTKGAFALVTRGKLPGAGGWSHQYGNAANTATSDDQRIKGGLGVLWYGDPGPGDMVNRHDGAVGPLSVNGRLFVQGDNTILAYDAYNGSFLWKYENDKALRTGVFQNQNPGNLATSEERVFHFVKDECFELDAATGKEISVHRLPKGKDNGKYEWGYIAVQDGKLYGTATIREEVVASQRRRGRRTDDNTDGIFAIDLATKKHLWAYAGKSISHRTIAIGPDKVFFIDSTITSDERAEILRRDKTALQDLKGEARKIAEDRLKKADLRRTVAIDSNNGKVLWKESVDVTDCSEIGIGGGKLTMMYQDGVLILGGANANGHYWSQFVKGEFKRRRLVALSADDGYKIWSKDANYRHRPIIIGGRVLAEPWAFDLKTGDQFTRQHPLTGKDVPWSIMRTGHHCGMLTGSESGMLLFRSGATGFYDMNTDEGTRHFAGHRLGCWINAIAANGLVLIPEASAGCVCQFSIASTIVMEPREARRPWTIYSAVGDQTPVKRMAINLGAPGDRRSTDGTIWFSYPRYAAYRETSLGVGLDLKLKFATGGGYQTANEYSVDVKGKAAEWVYTSWAQGLSSLSLPLLGKKDAPAKYDIRLHFANMGETDAVFDVKVQGETVLDNLILSGSSENKRTAIVHEIPGVSVTANLDVVLVPKKGSAQLNAIEATLVEPKKE